jgi:heptosyltransferase-2
MRVRVSILKPDHLGDLILAAPAIAALRRRFSEVTLLCHPKNLPLAEHLFPGLQARPLHLPHLDKDFTTDIDRGARRRLLKESVDLLICLRWDGQSERLLTTPEVEYLTPGPGHSERHVAAEQRELILPFTGPYDILKSYSYAHKPVPSERPSRLATVGLCIAAGFQLNSWPINNWLGLAERLSRHGTKVVLIGGPAELGRLQILADAVDSSLHYRPRVIVGGNDFGATLQAVWEQVDLIVANDSGTAHLVALVRPVISLFGGSPWRRFAPLGRHNVVLCRRYLCSPCQQFNRVAVNTCHTQECLTNLTPEQVYHCLNAYLAGLDLAQGVQLNGVWLMQAPWQTPERQAG